MKTVKKKAYGKINIFLDIESRKADGYHNIKSIMQTVDWYDEISVQNRTDSEIKISCSNSQIPCDKSNISYKVAKAFLDEIGSTSGVNIHIEKNIPISAGMAGGSADGAATLEALNELFNIPLSTENLISISKSIGADIPFCLIGGTKLIGGIGDIIEDTDSNLPNCFILCAKQDGQNISTPGAYKELDIIHQNFTSYSHHKTLLDNILLGIKEQNITTISQNVYNIFEETESARLANIAQIKDVMLKSGALCALMSGSGPSVFGIFTDEEKANFACGTLLNSKIQARVCKPINK